MSVMILDAGNCIIKAKIARRERGEVSFPHAIRRLTETEYSRIISRPGFSDPSVDYIRNNDQPYVVGESAERHRIITQRNRVARYTKDYYGILSAATLGRLYDRSREVAVFGSHTPGDVKFRQDLMESVVGDWNVEVKGKERHFRVSYANTFDEPVGGVMNVLLTEDGQHYQNEWKMESWESVNEMYTALPQSTEQILHPDKYWEEDTPQEISLPDVSSTLPSCWREEDQDVQGELLLRFILAEHLGPVAAEAAADDWGGDSYLLMSNTAEDQSLLVIQTGWDDQEAADEFWSLYQIYQRHRPEYNEVVETLVGELHFRLWSDGNNWTYLRRDDDRVTLLIAPSREVVFQLAEVFTGE